MSHEIKVHHLVARDLIVGGDPKPGKPARKPRKPNIGKMIVQAEKTGKHVRSVTTPDGTTLTFGQPEPIEQAASDLDRELAAWEARHAH